MNRPQRLGAVQWPCARGSLGRHPDDHAWPWPHARRHRNP